MNAGFNAATDLLSMGTNWKVKNSGLNASGSMGECPNSLNDITHRDAYGERIAPSAEYELDADVTSLPDLGTVVTVGTKKVAVNSITIKTTKGVAVSASVSGVQVEDGAATKRTYSCGTIALSCRHRAQDILGLIGSTTPLTLTDATFAFTCDITLSEPKGVIENHDVSNGKVVATYTHTVGDATAVTAPTLTGNDAAVSAPVSKTSPENDYTTYAYSITKSLTGTDEEE